MDDAIEFYAHPDDVAAADQTAARLFPGVSVNTHDCAPSGQLMVFDTGAFKQAFDELTSPLRRERR